MSRISESLLGISMRAPREIDEDNACDIDVHLSVWLGGPPSRDFGTSSFHPPEGEAVINAGIVTEYLPQDALGMKRPPGLQLDDST